MTDEPDVLKLLADLREKIVNGEVPDVGDIETCELAAKKIWSLTPKRRAMQIVGQWKDNVFYPLARYLRIVANYEQGVEVALEQVEERDMFQHRSYFATIKELYEGRPENWSVEFEDSEHMRKYALIRTGFLESADHIFPTRKEAFAFQAFSTSFERYAITKYRDAGDGHVVRLITPKSQRVWDGRGGMKNDEFVRSCKAVTEFCTDIIGCTRKEVSHVAQRFHKRGRT